MVAYCVPFEICGLNHESISDPDLYVQPVIVRRSCGEDVRLQMSGRCELSRDPSTC